MFNIPRILQLTGSTILFVMLSIFTGCSQSNEYKVAREIYCIELLKDINNELPDYMHFGDIKPLTGSMKKIQKKWVSLHYEDLQKMKGVDAFAACSRMKM